MVKAHAHAPHVWNKTAATTGSDLARRKRVEVASALKPDQLQMVDRH